MTTLNRKFARAEIAAGLAAALVGTGLPVKSVYAYQPGKLDGESPVVLVLSGPIQRAHQGMGTARYHNEIDLEIQVLIYDGSTSNPLTEAQREDKMDDIETAVADWFAGHQKGTYYRAVHYTPEPTRILNANYLDGNPYRIEVIPVQLEAPDL